MQTASTHITLLLDRTGSMASIRDEVIGGFNAFVADQQRQAGRATLTLVQFDSQHPYEVVHRALPIQDVPPLTTQTYVPRAATPLLDALGRAILDLEATLAALAEEERPEQVVLVVITDGQENASREFSKAQVTDLIQAKQAQGWQVVFLSADLDAIDEAVTTGIGVDQTLAFDATGQGTRQALASLSRHTSNLRARRAQALAFDAADRRVQHLEQRRRDRSGDLVDLNDPRLTNRQRLDALFAQGLIRLQRSPIFDEPPTMPRLDRVRLWDKVEGMLLGLAIGDSLGNTTEGMLPARRSAVYGEIRDYLPTPYADDQPVGVPSDDSQMAFWALEQMLEDGHLQPDRLWFSITEIATPGPIPNRFSRYLRI